MANVKISQLPAGTPTTDAVVCADNAAGTITEKILLGDIAKLATSADVAYDNGESGLAATNVKAALDELVSGKASLVAAPASATAAGVAGQIAYDADYIYICTADSTWKRVAVNSWDAPPPTITGFVADSSFGAAEGNYCPAGTHAGVLYYAGSTDGASNGWLLYLDNISYVWMLSQTDTPGVVGVNYYTNNDGDPNAVALTGWYNDTANNLTLSTGTVCFE